MRMYEVIDREKVLLETPEVLIERIRKKVPKKDITTFIEDLATKIKGQEVRDEDDLTLLWVACCGMLHNSMSPVKRDKDYMDMEDRRQDVYLMMIEVLDDKITYGTELFNKALKYRWDGVTHVKLQLEKNKYAMTNLEVAAEEHEPAMSIWMEDASNMREYLQKNYGDFAAEWFYLRFVQGYFDQDIYEMKEMTQDAYRWAVSQLKKKMKEDTTLLEMWESL